MPKTFSLVNMYLVFRFFYFYILGVLTANFKNTSCFKIMYPVLLSVFFQSCITEDSILLKNKPKISLTISPSSGGNGGCLVPAIGFFLVMFFITSWVVNAYRFTQLDFEAPYKAEVVRGAGIPMPLIPLFTAFMDIGEEENPK